MKSYIARVAVLIFAVALPVGAITSTAQATVNYSQPARQADVQALRTQVQAPGGSATAARLMPYLNSAYAYYGLNAATGYTLAIQQLELFKQSVAVFARYDAYVRAHAAAWIAAAQAIENAGQSITCPTCIVH